MPYINYRELYSTPGAAARKAATELDKAPNGPKGLQLPGGRRARSSSRVQSRCLAVSLLFAGAFLWNVLGGRAPAASDDAAGNQIEAEGVPVPPSELEPRRLNSTPTVTCVDGVTPARQADLQNINLLMVDKSHLTSVGCPVTGAAICLKSGYMWMLVFYFLGVLYMFCALAIVCDEFFVPALEVFVEENDISMDVAGATFMAAGGSMPELFTSFFATFAETDVGFAAIVGSAVFNVLFVIAVCAIASKTVLELTWWPLARDCSFYVIFLFTVVIVFLGSSPNIIEWWEAVILLCEYVLYCSFMKFNTRVQKWVTSRGKTQVTPMQDVKAEDVALRISGQVNLRNQSLFRKGIVQLLTADKHIYETAGIAAVTQIQGSLEDTFGQLDKDGDGYISPDELVNLLGSLGLKQDSAAINTALARINRKGESAISFDAFKKWYIASEARIEIEVRKVFDKFDTDGSGTIEKDEISALFRSLGHKISDDELGGIIEDLVGPCGDVEVMEADEPERKTDFNTIQITFEQFERWYSKSMFWQLQHKQHLQEEEAEDGALSLECPDGASWSAAFWWFISYPLCAMMYITLPDIRNPKYKRSSKIAVLEFVLSLVWIGLFSNCLFDWTVVCSYSLGIPPPVAGVTVLAAGTSIPDLFSSYIVARQGMGDMAVSSSIGSNIFDVTVGLPLPWICYILIKGKPVKVLSNNLGFSVLVLIFMLVAVITTVMICRWRMTKTLGYVMLLLYLVFVAQDLLQQLPDGNPIINIQW
mmetsp:Transcript_41669/g.94030  ORF Transcript_41669/g.94030 Transcript_41669/m.94030 type:complete len:760 (+) Transcript_41669:191-2470(+)|eukprot:CAMPEP_0197884550 /NCGR_PEP_ID=MMETSP1439-20131203/10962_1 /TAXON_ID=66791 /ORGANISM="Gonyaulax spinifera, Strain CCMP409" /LENGTH=759 /DNA_ID=CAMNT_0043504285 /DNA_START=191 /DNA_END=2467 /DNA_ORIENTATION=+